MGTVAEKLLKLKEQIAKKALDCGRDPDAITLVAVTKFADASAIKEAYDAGQRDFGENYVQKVLPKMEVLPNDIRWHFIGAVQKNKINKILGKFVLVHSVDSQKIADAMNIRAERFGLVQDILIEVNTSGEETKRGIPPEKVYELAMHINENCPNLKLLGLMTMAPYTDDRTVIERCFKGLRNLRDELAKYGIELPHLSMGMTNDWGIAVEHGATILRIGTAIFG